MDNSMLTQLPVDPAFLILGLAVLTILLMIIVIICLIQMRKLYRRYDYFMRGKDAETLEEIIMDQMEDISELKIGLIRILFEIPIKTTEVPFRSLGL